MGDERLYVENLRKCSGIVAFDVTTRFEPGDVVAVSGRRQALVELGNQADEVEDRELLAIPVETVNVFVTAKAADGARLVDLAREPFARGVYLTSIRRGLVGVELPILARTEIQRGCGSAARELEAGFDVLSTRLHLARIALVTEHVDAAGEHVARVWDQRADAPPYVVPRILWMQLALTLFSSAPRVDLHEVGIVLGRLKTALAREGAHAEWTMDPVLAHLQPKVTPEDHDC